MADSKVEIQVTANTDDAKQKLAQLEAAADKAMDSGANSAKRFAKGLDEVGKSAELSARQIKGVVAGMASMAAGVASAALKANGREREASYLGGAASGAAQGAGMLAPLGGAAMAAGALAGAGIGAARTYFEREAQGKAEAASMRDLADALEKARETMDAAQKRADAFAGTSERLGDVSRSTNEREAEREKEIARRREEIAAATDRMTKAEEALRQQAANIDGPQTEEQKKAADAIREAWAKANQDLQTAQGELDRLKDANIQAAKKADLKPLDQRGDGPQLSNLEKLGASFGGATDGLDGAASRFADAVDAFTRSSFADATDALEREGNRLAEEQLDVLKTIANKAGAPAAFA